MKKCSILFLVLFFSSFLFPQSVPPKREFRAVWVSTVLQLDWPSSYTPSSQQSQLISILDNHKTTGINAVMFQIRPECDALYQSSIEPWSRWLTGSQGAAPSPMYDPLEFAINEAHKRGIELHAWFNPYRAERAVGNYTLSPNHVVIKNPNWILQVGTVKFLNPGLQEVRDYVTSVFMDVVRRYDVDGIHIDDYFYVEGITNQDAATFTAFPRGFSNLSDWRRDNVNLLMKQINDSINAVKPWVKWGVSPRGIWRPGYPSGITGNDNYNSIYCDAMAWLHDKSIDYINPQLYWKFGGGQDYAKLMPWWADSANANGRHLYTGNATYRMGGSDNWPVTELLNQLNANRTNNKVQGNIQFRSYHLTSNLKGFNDSLKNNQYKYPALPPVMIWKDAIPPGPVKNLNAVVNNYNVTLTWEKPDPATDGDTAYYYIIYKFNDQTAVSIDDPRYIKNMDFSRTKAFTETNAFAGGIQEITYVVTSVDRMHNESIINSITVDPNGVIPVELLAFNALLQTGKVILDWETGTEVNNFGFEIQRKILVEEEFSVIAFIKGKGTTSEKSKYSFTDDLSELKNVQKISYRLKQVDFDGTFEYSYVINVDFKPVPKQFTLGQNYPNPFNPSTRIKYSIPDLGKEAAVQLKIYDLLGNEISTLVNEIKEPGNYEVNFDGNSTTGALSSGLYIYKLNVNGSTLSGKMLLMK